jgi:hypothetical protein
MVAALLAAQAGPAAAQTSPGTASMYAYVGSFTSAQRKARGDGIHVYRADPATGAWTQVQHVGDLVNPSYLALSHDQRVLYSVHGDEEYATAFAFDPKTGEAKPAISAHPPLWRLDSADYFTHSSSFQPSLHGEG